MKEREKKLAKSIWWKFAFNNYDLIAINKTRFAVLSKFVDSFPWKVIVEIRELRASQPAPPFIWEIIDEISRAQSIRDLLHIFMSNYLIRSSFFT